MGWVGETGDALDLVVEPIDEPAWPPDPVEQQREGQRELDAGTESWDDPDARELLTELRQRRAAGRGSSSALKKKN